MNRHDLRSLISETLDRLGVAPGDSMSDIVRKASAAMRRELRLMPPMEQWRGTPLTAVLVDRDTHSELFYAPHHSALYQFQGQAHEVGHFVTSTDCRHLSDEETRATGVPMGGLVAAYARKIERPGTVPSFGVVIESDFLRLSERTGLWPGLESTGENAEDTEVLVETFAYELAKRVRDRPMNAFGEVFA